MDSDIAAELERVVPPAPPETAGVEELLLRGRRALRRRRLAGAAAIAAMVVAAGAGVGLGTLDGSSRAIEPTLVTRTTPTPGVPHPTPTAAPTPAPWAHVPGAPITTGPFPHDADLSAPHSLAAYGVLSGRLYVMAGVRVLRWIDNPYRVRAPGRSDGLELEYLGSRYFYAMTYEADRSSAGAQMRAAPHCPTFRAWIRDNHGMTPSGVNDPSQVNLHVVGSGGS